MSRESLDQLESIDLSTITVSDLASMKNEVLRKALVSAINAVEVVGAEHTNHWKFTSHGQAHVIDFEVLFRGRAPGGG